MIKIGIVDDEAVDLRILEEIIRKYFNKYQYTTEYKVYRFMSGVELLKCMDEKFELIILDYLMPVMDGYETAVNIRKTDKLVKIIFLTGVNDSWRIGYKVSAYRYILKPINEEAFIEDLDDTIKDIMEDKKMVAFEVDNGFIKLQVSDLLYAESNGRFTDIHVLRGSHEIETITIHSGISFVEQKLSQYGFIQPHISYCVNKMHVMAIMTERGSREKYMVLSNKEKIGISRDRKKDVIREMKKYLEGILL